MAEIRAFIAISLPSAFQSQLDLLINQLKEQLPGVPVRWMQARNIHLTLKFLGNISGDHLEVLRNCLVAEASRHHAFDIRLGQPGAFPSFKQPRVVWVGVIAPEELNSLARGIDHQTSKLGYPSENRPFSPHLTLGRTGKQISNHETRRLGEVVESLKVDYDDTTTVAAIHLYRSDLDQRGAVYTRLFSASLQGKN